MKQLLIADNVAYPTSANDYSSIPDGAIAIFQNGNFIDGTNPSIDKQNPFSIVLGRTIDDGGPLPINEVDIKSLSVNKGEYKAATTFTVTITIPDVEIDKDYTLVVVKKGVQFNERNKWTATVKCEDNDTPSTIADKLTKFINNNSDNSGVKAENTNAEIKITATSSGIDYSVVPSDNLFGAEVSSYTAGIPSYGDKKFVEDLAQRTAADKGFEYTYSDGASIYPKYPETPTANSYTIYNLRFANSRKSGTHDELIYQTLQLAIPTGAPMIETLDKIFAAI